jgi:PAS domain S-box-containing protein
MVKRMSMPSGDAAPGGMPGPTDDQTRSLLEMLVGCATVGIAFIDRQFRVAYLNPTLALINGVPVAELRGRPVAEVFPHATTVVLPTCRQVIESSRPVTHVEYTRVLSPGDPGQSWIADYFPVSAPDGAVIGVGVLVVDVTERQQAEAARRRLAQSQREEMATGLQAARGLAHRINNQLALAIGYGDLLGSHPSLDDNAREYLQRSLEGLASVAETVNGLLTTVTLAHLKAGGQETVDATDRPT